MNQYIDHTNLNATATVSDIKKLCDEAVFYKFKSVCINPCYVAYCKNYLAGSTVLVCTVIGFPLGANSTATKIAETIEAVRNGADEIDMVINIGKLKAKDFDYITNEIRKIREIAPILKVIFETCYLTDEEKINLCEIVTLENADFAKTSTGFGSLGATLADVRLLSHNTGIKVGVKASGGIRDLKTAQEMIAAGATRIGSSNGVKIMEELYGNTSY